jgi:large exoprotein involved in heme utilization and adhesion
MLSLSKPRTISYFLSKYFRVFTIICITASSLVISYTHKALGQITLDMTLPNNFNVRVQDKTNVIEAGTRELVNLFHSFKEFSISNGNEAMFNNAIDIKNIITRVTGQKMSKKIYLKEECIDRYS